MSQLLTPHLNPLHRFREQLEIVLNHLPAHNLKQEYHVFCYYFQSISWASRKFSGSCSPGGSPSAAPARERPPQPRPAPAGLTVLLGQQQRPEVDGVKRRCHHGHETAEDPERARQRSHPCHGPQPGSYVTPASGALRKRSPEAPADSGLSRQERRAAPPRGPAGQSAVPLPTRRAPVSRLARRSAVPPGQPRRPPRRTCRLWEGSAGLYRLEPAPRPRRARQRSRGAAPLAAQGRGVRVGTGTAEPRGRAAAGTEHTALCRCPARGAPLPALPLLGCAGL